MKSKNRGIQCVLFVAGAMAGISSVEAHGLKSNAPVWSPAQPVSVNTAAGEGCPIETPDGLSLFFASNRAGGVGANALNDIWVADRDSLTSPWKEPKNIGEPINTIAADFCPTPVGRSLYFVSERATTPDGGTPCGGGDMYLTRQSPTGGWGSPVLLKCAPEGPNFPGGERSPSLVETWFGTFLFYSSSGHGAQQDIYVSHMGPDGNFGPGKLVKDLSTPEYNEIMPNVRARDDGSFEIVFSSDRPNWGKKNKPAFGMQDVYYSRSFWLTGMWSPPENLGENINGALNDQRSTLSNDGKRLYLGKGPDMFVSERKR